MGETEVGARYAKASLELAKLVERPHVYGFALLATLYPQCCEAMSRPQRTIVKKVLNSPGGKGFPEFVALPRLPVVVRVRHGAAEAGIKQMEEGIGFGR